jgi:hypothetical protein
MSSAAIASAARLRWLSFSHPSSFASFWLVVRHTTSPLLCKRVHPVSPEVPSWEDVDQATSRSPPLPPCLALHLTPPLPFSPLQCRRAHVCGEGIGTTARDPGGAGPERWLFEFCVYVMYVAKLAVILFAKTVKLWLSF